ncbi:hypothetical protein [Dongia sp.]|uniref:hypothetical protein n=1 Tax=Dongia sp. TaxID=1977262 RepID=UPI0037527502
MSEMTDDEIRAAVAEHETAHNEQHGHVLIDYLLQRGTDDLAAGLQAALIGDPDTLSQVKAGGPVPFWSAKARHHGLLVLLLGALVSDLEKRNLYTLWTSGGPDFDRAVARALWQLSGAKHPASANGHPPAQAVAMAEIIANYVRIARKVQNKEGGYRHAYPGELIGGSHDSLKLKRAGKESWISFIEPLLDDRTFEHIRRDVFLDLAFDSIGLYQDDPRLFLYFKDADSWIEYNLRFGLVTLRDAVVAGLERATRRAGLTAVLGTQPAEVLNGVLRAFEQETKKTFDPRVTMLLHGTLSGLEPIWPGHLDAQTEREITAAARQNLVNLGEALFPELEDMPAFSADVPFYGTTLFDAIDVQLGKFIAGAGVDAPERRPDFALGVGMFGTAFNAALADRFVSLDSPPGRAAELLRQFLKLNVVFWWTEVTRRASHIALSAFLGEKMRVGFSKIDPAFAATLSQYGIDAGKWEVVRAIFGVVRLDTPPSETVLREARSGTDAWLNDRIVVASLGIEEEAHRRFMRGVADFTAEGELLRFLAQFRQFRAPFLPKAHGKAEVREADQAMHKAMAEGDGLPALASLLTWTVLFARLRQLSFDFIRDGASTPPGVKKGDDEEGDDAPWFEAAMAGGALGLCADLLFGDTTGLKSTPLSAMTEILNPAFASALRIWRQARNGDDVRASLAEWAKGQGTALDRLQVTRRVLNTALLHQFQDMMSPGYLQRTMKEI